MVKKYKTNRERFEQLEFCKYTDELGHPLENNIAYIELKKITNELLKEALFYLNDIKPEMESACSFCSADDVNEDYSWKHKDSCILIRIKNELSSDNETMEESK
jgi:hypothetical protein